MESNSNLKPIVISVYTTDRVKKAECIKTKKLVALKILKPEELSKDFEKEARILAKLNHKHITNLIEVLYQVPYKKKNGEEIIRNVIVIELASHGHFFNIIRASVTLNGHGLPEIVTRTFFKQMISALEYCHSNGVVHRDIKTENVLLDEEFNLKLADFGWATLIDHKKHSTLAGSEEYVIILVGFE